MTYQTLHSFTGTGGDGRVPLGGLLQGSDGALYGTTAGGGSYSDGTIFKLNKDGTGYTVLYSFGSVVGDGVEPYYGRLVQGSDGALYGTTMSGGSNGGGTVFKLTTLDGISYTETVLHSFPFLESGAGPWGGLVLASDGALYGTTYMGGGGTLGTVFKLNTDGTGFTVVFSFPYFYTGPSAPDGAYPAASLVQGSDGALYGTTEGGGNSGYISGYIPGYGTVFNLSTADGINYTEAVLHNFTGPTGDGKYPYASLMQGSDGAFYGTTTAGGSGAYSTLTFGTVFRVNADGSGYRVLYNFLGNFTAGVGDGYSPVAGLVQGSDGALYGITDGGGSGNHGTVFKLNTDGTGYTVLHSFGTFTGDGEDPQAGLMRGSDGALYGTTSNGGASGNGVVFRLVPATTTTITPGTIPDQAVVYGTAYSYSFPAGTFTDSDSSKLLSYSAAGLPPGISFDGSTRTFRDTPTAVGTYTVTVTATDNNSPPASASTSFRFTVTPAPLTIAADGKSKAYGAPLPPFTGTASGLVNGDTLASLSGTLTFTTSATAASPVGTYTIVPGGLSSPNYTITFSNGALTITAAPLTITANNQSKVYGAALPALTVSYSGFVNGDTPASLTTPPTITTTASVSSPVGTYAITASGAADPNYTISYVAGTLTVTSAPLAITANNQSKVYGAALPALTVSYSGFVNGDTAASLTTPPTVTTTASASSPVGTYAITASGAVDPNYTISYVAGTLTVAPASLTITANNQSKVYGAALPALTVSYSGFVNGDTPASLTTPPTVTTTASASSAVGTYAITASGAADPNYTISYVAGTLTVTSAPLTITASNATKMYGTALSFAGTEFSASGLVNGDTVNSVSLASDGAAAEALVNNSPYAIIPSAALGTGLTNYTTAYVNGSLTVTPAPLTATVNGPTMGYVLPINSSLTFGGGFSPSGVIPYIATWTFTSADATPITVAGSIAADNTISSPSVMFSLPGVYVVTLTVQDGAGTIATGTMSTYLVIYDPN
ncbi:MAG: putative Ig domain-containing protein, partial [Verrucomicrobia bacterium]|nr:putative Ig domain-containing protein [Verrucomicrobiota bacterium]